MKLLHKIMSILTDEKPEAFEGMTKSYKTTDGQTVLTLDGGKNWYLKSERGLTRISKPPLKKLIRK